MYIEPEAPNNVNNNLRRKCAGCPMCTTCAADPSECPKEKFIVNKHYLYKCESCIHYKKNNCEIEKKHTCVGPYVIEGVLYNNHK